MDFQYRDILLNDAQLGPYPREKLPRVDKPPTEYISEIKPRYENETGMAKALRTEAGRKMRESGEMFFNRDPLCSAYSSLQNHIAKFELPPTAEQKAPLPDDPRILSRHIKSLGYFLGADMVGICRLPSSAVYANVQEKEGEAAFYENAVLLLNVKKTNVMRQSYGRELD
jgi:hypothetical protein